MSSKEEKEEEEEVTLVLDDGSKLKCCKKTLQKSSPYFRAMFSRVTINLILYLNSRAKIIEIEIWIVYFYSHPMTWERVKFQYKKS